MRSTSFLITALVLGAALAACAGNSGDSGDAAANYQAKLVYYALPG